MKPVQLFHGSHACLLGFFVARQSPEVFRVVAPQWRMRAGFLRGQRGMLFRQLRVHWSIGPDMSRSRYECAAFALGPTHSRITALKH